MVQGKNEPAIPAKKRNIVKYIIKTP
jgi:hypothetical protein